MLTMFKPLPTKGTEVAPSLTDLDMLFCFWFWLKFSFEGELMIGPVEVATGATTVFRFWCC